MAACVYSSNSSAAGHDPFERVTNPMERTDAGVATPRKDEPPRHAAADHLIVEDVGRHPDELEVRAPLANGFVTGSERDQMREALECDPVLVADDFLDALGERYKPRAQAPPPCTR
jgi:hypothetical protein